MERKKVQSEKETKLEMIQKLKRKYSKKVSRYFNN